jgi:hypothetical protein
MARRLVSNFRPEANRGIQAFDIQIEDLGARRPVAAGLCTASLQDEQQQAKRYRFGRLGIVHRLGAPVRFCRASWQDAVARVFGKRIAFENYQRLNERAA